MAGREEILGGYNYALQEHIAYNERISRYNVTRVKRGQKPLPVQPYTPAAYMMERAPGNNKVTYRGKVYYTSYGEGIPDSDPKKSSKAADSAGRAYRKLLNREPGSSGEKIYARASQYEYRDKFGNVTLGKPRGQYEMGLWMIVVTYLYTDSDNVEHGPVTKSFIVQDEQMRFRSQFDTPQMMEELNKAIEDRMLMWAANGSDASSNYVILSAVPVRIQSTSKTRDTRTQNYIVML